MCLVCDASVTGWREEGTPPIGCSDTEIDGELGSELSGEVAAPLSSGTNVWQAPRPPL